MSLEDFMENTLLDKYCYDTIDKNDNMLVPWYLMAAYAYYVEDDPIVTDQCYDKLATRLLERWDDVEHRHKTCIDYDALKSGTFLGTYPSLVEGAVEQIRNELLTSE